MNKSSQGEGVMYYEKAGFGERLVAYLIDSCIVGLIAGVPAGCVGVIAGVMVDLESSSGFGTLVLLIFLALSVTSVASILYYGLMWSRTGQTYGKKIMGLRVVTLDGGLPGFWPSVGRVVVGYGISSVAFNLGFLWMLWDDQQQTWHDKMFGTFVVKS
jgi:uncharacterized RDD family membrane protein YckC